MIIKANCRGCGKLVAIQVALSEYRKWKRGSLIREAFPYMTPEDRMFLICEYCGPCFKTQVDQVKEEHDLD